MCDVGKALSRAFTAPGTGGQEAGYLDAFNLAQGSADTAFAALTKAINEATKASLPLLDNPSALAAQRAQMQKTLAAQGSAWSFGKAPAAAPTTATRILTGV